MRSFVVSLTVHDIEHLPDDMGMTTPSLTICARQLSAPSTNGGTSAGRNWWRVSRSWA